MQQTPATEDFLLKWRGDTLKVTLTLDRPRPGRAAFRTNLGNAGVRRREIIAETESGTAPLARAWTDIPLAEVSPGVYAAEIALNEVGIFSGKACFFPEGSSVPEWPEGRNTHIKVEPADTRRGNSIYCVFPRQFGSFREVVRRLPVIMDEMGFGIIQTLPPFPVPTTYAVMGEYGCPFAATDFLSVDPAMAEFDEFATPLDQFRELIDAVHARRGRFLIDLPANHTGWASTLQTHHPEWFRHEVDGRFHSPGAWGVKWADLVELDYANAELRAYMAEVFLFWCRNGADGFRCDAGYMIPAETWEYIVARVREEFPDTIFMLEGLGGELAVTDRLLGESNLDWAYSEIFQTYDRRQFEWYLPAAIARAERYGALVHFAETHDNDRLAKGGEVYARLRVQLAALLSWQGAWGIANGVEWYCCEKIDVHGKNALGWGAAENMVALIGRLNRLLETNPYFAGENHLRLITRGGGNTLAVVRDGGLLVLANLDCGAPAVIDWDRSAFGFPAARDLVAGREFDLRQPVELAPGEVLALEAQPRPTVVRGEPAPRDRAQFEFTWQYPRDLRRVVAVPAGRRLRFAAAHPFRLQIVEPETGRTLACEKSADEMSESAVTVTMPPYVGDGTACRRLEARLVIFAPERPLRFGAPLMVPPSSRRARAKLAMSGEEVRRQPDCRLVLSNGAGAASQLRVGWGMIASQYDAMLAANPNPSVPSDRLNLWARTRCWLQREGYMREIDRRVVTKVTCDPAGRGARWDLHVPCGMGLSASFAFELTLAEGENAARLRVTRCPQGESNAEGSVRLVFRPDLEWRSFHSATKAFAGLEQRFPGSSEPLPGGTGVSFRPYEGEFRLTVPGGCYHHEPQWSYNVGHPEEAARGQEPAGDLYSPGWISADLKIGDTLDIVGEYLRRGEAPGRSYQWRMDKFPVVVARPFGEVLKESLELFIVRRDELKTVIAGYPWFLDWGRDTFIFLRGMIAAGKLAEAMKILRAFAAFEENGTLPNIIYGQTAGNRDTTDAQLWFVRCVQEIEARGCDVSQLRRTCESIVDHYLSGTPNGIRMDPESALVWSPSHFTWMDTNYPACTPRIGYPVEIQALWISALKYLGRQELADRALASVRRHFAWEHGYRDCLSAPHGESAARAVPEDTIRPNQLFLITLGVLDEVSILKATEELLIPGGIRSLNAGHPLYRGVYAGDEDSSRKPAYHNGTVWAWPFPQFAEALVMAGLGSRETALQLLATAVENFNCGCLAHLSENADGDAPHAQKGCTAQAWSDSEFLRVWLKLGGK